MSTTDIQQSQTAGQAIPGEDLAIEKMPGHWLLAHLGKRVLRPGGRHLTESMIRHLQISASDEVVEFAPGMGFTAQLTLERNPMFYTGIERDPVAARQVRQYLHGANRTCEVASADDTGLPDHSASVVYGEAMLTMQTPKNKARIVQESHRILKSGGRYGIHELSLTPDDLSEEKKAEIEQALSRSIRVGARPLTTSEWTQLLETHGFTVEHSQSAPMHLLNIRRFIQDEGLLRSLKFIRNVLTNPAARKRILDMRRVFTQYENSLSAICLTAVKN